MRRVRQYILGMFIFVLSAVCFMPGNTINAASIYTCGPNATWSISEDGTLTISGTGVVRLSPWMAYADKITSIVIKEGITTIVEDEDVNTNEYYDYFNLKNVTSLTIPSTLKEVPFRVFSDCSIQKVQFTGKPKTLPAFIFYDCKQLKTIELPDSITTIKRSAFNGCSTLTNVKLPKNLKVIEEGAFFKCNNLKQLTLPKSCTKLGTDAFAYNKTNIRCTIGKGIYRITKDNDTVHKVSFVKPVKTTYTSFTIPATVKIAGRTFKVTSIASNAFLNNKKLKNLTMKSTTLTSIGKDAFKNIYAKAKIYVPKKKVSAYKKLITSTTGYKKTMKIVGK